MTRETVVLILSIVLVGLMIALRNGWIRETASRQAGITFGWLALAGLDVWMGLMTQPIWLITAAVAVVAGWFSYKTTLRMRREQ